MRLLFLKNKETKMSETKPEYYIHASSGVECSNLVRYMSFNIGNAIKYVFRAGLKDKAALILDLEKALEYIKEERRVPVRDLLVTNKEAISNDLEKLLQKEAGTKKVAINCLCAAAVCADRGHRLGNLTTAEFAIKQLISDIKKYGEAK
jgi:hypothetical protein